MADLYEIVLCGQGDEMGALVDKETWEWIHSDVPPYAQGKTGWSEKEIMPARVKEAIKQQLAKYPGDDYPLITIGSYVNDRAIAVCVYPGAAIRQSSLGDEDAAEEELDDWAVKHDHQVVETFYGYIY